MSDHSKSICVFAGSSPGARPDYAAAARALAEALAEREIELVYGGGDVGLMGILADRMLELGGRVIGVIPGFLADKEVAHQKLTELRIVDSMHERKAEMAELASAFIALPGGIGTIEELFEVFTWAQLGVHAKPCGMLNVAGYYDPIVAFLDHMAAERFIKPEHRAILMVEQNADRLLDAFAAYAPRPEDKWMDREQS